MPAFSCRQLGSGEREGRIALRNVHTFPIERFAVFIPASRLGECPDAAPAAAAATNLSEGDVSRYRAYANYVQYGQPGGMCL
jgi:hypothetical protein